MMLFTMVLLGTLLMSAFVSSLPRVQKELSGGFSIMQTAKRRFQSPAAEMMSIFEKYDQSVPDSLREANEANVAGKGNVDTIIPVRGSPADDLYLGQVAIGDRDKQIVNLLLDTGSVFLWAFGPDLAAATDTGHSIYDPTQSSSSQQYNKDLNISYGGGAARVTGPVYTDWITAGSTTFKVEIGVASSVTGTLEPTFMGHKSDMDGILGLGYGRVDVWPTFVEAGAASGDFQSKVFTADLRHAAPGCFSFGYVDSTKYVGPISWATVSSVRSHWEIDFTGYAVGDGGFVSTNFKVLPDTGTSLIILPDDIAAAYWSQVPGAYRDQSNLWLFPCDTALPDFKMQIGDNLATLPGQWMARDPENSNPEELCQGGLTGNMGADLSILGDVWLRTKFMIYDQDNHRVGWANKVVW